jgi:exonuclease I
MKIFKITNIINNKVFIAESISEKGYGFIDNRYFRNAQRIFGDDNFTIEILCRCRKEALKKLKEFYIKKYNSKNFQVGYNAKEFSSKLICLTYQRWKNYKYEKSEREKKFLSTVLRG